MTGLELLAAAGAAVGASGGTVAAVKLIDAWRKRIEASADLVTAEAGATRKDADVTAKRALAEVDAIKAEALVDAALAAQLVAMRSDIDATRAEVSRCESGRAADRLACAQAQAADKAECVAAIDALQTKVATLTERVNSVTPPSTKAVTP